MDVIAMFFRLTTFRHRRLRGLLSAYIDGRLSPREVRRLERHLARCDACRRELEELRVTVALLRGLPTLELPRSFTLAAPPTPAPARPRWLAAGLGVASAAAALLLAALVVGEALGLVGPGAAVARPESAAAPSLGAPLPPSFTRGGVEEAAPAMAAAPPPGTVETPSAVKRVETAKEVLRETPAPAAPALAPAVQEFAAASEVSPQEDQAVREQALGKVSPTPESAEVARAPTEARAEALEAPLPAPPPAPTPPPIPAPQVSEARGVPGLRWVQLGLGLLALLLAALALALRRRASGRP